MIFATAFRNILVSVVLLWIAFVPWNYDICNSCCNNYCSMASVVNCFCSLKLWYLQQRLDNAVVNDFVVNCFCSLKLWYLQQPPLYYYYQNLVVNCFCSLKLWYLQQHLQYWRQRLWCCELLLFLEIMIFATAGCTPQKADPSLWIAFVPWNYDICNSI